MDKLEVQVLEGLREKKRTLATAESCTGGWLGKRLTDMPGSSAVYLGGVISYSNSVKAEVLHVPQELLVQFGAVSEPVARAMAEGVCRLTGSDIGVSITGIAGPGSDNTAKPVGLVYLAVADRNGTNCKQLHLQGDRTQIRVAACDAALAFVIEKCLEANK